MPDDKVTVQVAVPWPSRGTTPRRGPEGAWLHRAGCKPWPVSMENTTQPPGVGPPDAADAGRTVAVSATAPAGAEEGPTVTVSAAQAPPPDPHTPPLTGAGWPVAADDAGTGVGCGAGVDAVVGGTTCPLPPPLLVAAVPLADETLAADTVAVAVVGWPPDPPAEAATAGAGTVVEGTVVEGTVVDGTDPPAVVDVWR